MISRGRWSGSGRRLPLRGGLAGKVRPDGAAAASCRASFVGLGLLHVADHQFEQVDLAVELLRRLAEPRPPQGRQLGLQLLDMQGLDVELRLQGRRERTQGVRIRRQFRGGERHAGL